MLKKHIIYTFLISISLIITSFQDPQKQAANKNPLNTIIIDAGHGLPDPGAMGRYSSESEITLAIALELGEKLKEALPETKILFTRTNQNLPNGLTDRNVANRYRANFANENSGDLFIAIHVNSAADKFTRKLEGYKTETYTVTTGKGKKKKHVTKTRQVPLYKSYRLPCGVKGTETYIWAVNKYDQKQAAVGKKEDDDMFGEQGDSTYKYFESPEAKIMASLRTKKYFNQSLAVASMIEEEFKKDGRHSFGVKQRNHEGIWVLQATNMPSILVETGFICTPEEEDYLNSVKGRNEITGSILRAIVKYKKSLETTNKDITGLVK